MASQEIPFVGPIINRLFGTRNERLVKKYVQRVDVINDRKAEMRSLSDEEVRGRTEAFRQRFLDGERWSDILPEAFAVAREAMDRNVGIRNIFNPEYVDRFPADRLSDAHRKLYEETRAAIEAAEPREPADELAGYEEPVPAWLWWEIPHELYDAVREIFPESKPPFRSEPFDVQLIGGMVLYQGAIAEMKTGEGKTIVAPLAAYLAALEGHKVHVVTVNDYLVQRDRDWTAPFFRGLGLTVGAIHPQHMQPEPVKRLMYGCDVVYGTTSEFGFDYLRDNMKRSADQQVQRYREFAIVDEVDSTLIDEARTPLIISGEAHEEQPRYDLADRVARHLVACQKEWDAADAKVERCKEAIKGTEGDIRNTRDKSAIPTLQKKLADLKKQLPELEAERDRFTQFYESDREKRRATLTHQGVAEAQRHADVGSIYVGENTDLPHLIEQALRAHVIYERDTDYIVMPVPDPRTGRTENDVVIVDANTGRAMVGRQWSDGLHQAVQAKEGLTIRPETQTVASITIQNFFKMYKRLAGMTGTADTEAQEFHDIYELEVVTIPTNLPVIRADHNDTVYLREKDKWDAIVDEIKVFHDLGRPILVGTTSVEKSEKLARMLQSAHGIEHQILNAKQHEAESKIIERAGQLGAVMIATNMAGRGTDIKLGRVTRPQLVEHWQRRSVAPRDLSPEDDVDALREKVFRKVAPKVLDVPKREAEQMDFPELELMLLRRWAEDHTWADAGRIEKATADELRDMLDAEGRFALHRIDWVDSVEEMGGLHVIGTERHESRRIDNQLRGRAGRQGDRGSSRFFISLEDDLMKMFAGQTTMRILQRLGMKEGDAIENPMLTKSVARAQRKVEERNFQIRKNILEYDEVMEHQRQEFYGLRQRVLDGYDLRGLVFEFVEDAVRENVERYLDKDFFAERVAEFASAAVGVSIPPERLRGKELDEVEAVIRRTALEEAHHEVDITIGEYVPDGAELVDIDVKGLTNWAASRFGIELTSQEIAELSRKELAELLVEGARERVEATDLSGAKQFLVPNYGATQLVEWVRGTLLVEMSVEDVVGKETDEGVVEAVMSQVRERYDEREVNYPVEFVFDLTAQMVQRSPQDAIGNLVGWAKTRFGIEWTPEDVQKRDPKTVRDELLGESRRFVDEGRLDAAIAEAQQHEDADSLDEYVRERYGRSLPHWMKRLRGDELARATRSVVEANLRSELVQFERYILLDVLDRAWKNHLYEMDQLRDAIGFRAFSQQDPRIEYKREGARLFGEMMASLHDKVTDAVFKMRLAPQVGMPGGARRPPQQPQRPPTPAGAGAGSGIGMGGGIVGPGLG